MIKPLSLRERLGFFDRLSVLYIERFSFTPVVYHINSKIKSVKEVDIHAIDE